MKKAISLFAIAILTLVLNFPLNANENADIELKATIAGISNGDISRELLLKSGEIQCSDQKYKIVSYTLSLTKNRNLIELYGFGNKFTKLMRNVIQGIEPGHKLTIKDICAKNAKGKIFKLPFIVLYLN